MHLGFPLCIVGDEGALHATVLAQGLLQLLHVLPFVCQVANEQRHLSSNKSESQRSTIYIESLGQGNATVVIHISHVKPGKKEGRHSHGGLENRPPFHRNPSTTVAVSSMVSQGVSRSLGNSNTAYRTTL